MSVIAIVDDRAQMRESVVERIRLGLEDMGLDWEVISQEPLPEVDDYPEWITENDVSLLVIDEKLGEEIGPSGVATSYSGHEVATNLRDRIPDLPQMIITSIKRVDELEGAAELDAIVQRDEFDKHWKVHVERMVRLATRFVDRNEDELAELSDISQKIVDGSASQEQIDRLNAIRERVQMRVKGDNIVVLRQVLTGAEEIKDKLQALLDRIERRMQS